MAVIIVMLWLFAYRNFNSAAPYMPLVDEATYYLYNLSVRVSYGAYSMSNGKGVVLVEEA